MASSFKICLSVIVMLFTPMGGANGGTTDKPTKEPEGPTISVKESRRTIAKETSDSHSKPKFIKVEGAIKEDIVHRIFWAHRNETRYCIEKKSMQTDPFTGRIDIEFDIDGSGKVIQPSDAGTPNDGKPISDCIIAKVKSWKFPAPNNGNTKVFWHFMTMQAHP